MLGGLPRQTASSRLLSKIGGKHHKVEQIWLILCHMVQTTKSVQVRGTYTGVYTGFQGHKNDTYVKPDLDSDANNTRLFSIMATLKIRVCCRRLTALY